MLLYTPVSFSSLLLSGITLYNYATIYLSISPLMVIWVVSNGLDTVNKIMLTFL